ncbi:MAG: hypothetical protein ACO1OB_28640 [Archangium sp.]
MNFTELAKKSFDIVWKQKSLWLFGFFAMAGGGTAANNSVTRKSTGGSADLSALPTWLWPVLAVVAVVGVIALLMHVISEAALIDGVKRATNADQPSVKSGLASGRHNFWRVVGVKLGLGVASALVAIGMAVPALLAVFDVLPVWLAVVLSVPLIIIGVPVLLSLQFITNYALRIAVLDDVGVREAIVRARQHLNGRVIDSVKLLLAAFIAQAVGSLATLTCLVPGAAIGVGVWALTDSVLPAVITGVIISAPFAAMALGATGALRSTVWTLGFLDGRAEALS